MSDPEERPKIKRGEERRWAGLPVTCIGGWRLPDQSIIVLVLTPFSERVPVRLEDLS